MFDSTLTKFTAIRDSISGPTGYGGLTSNLIPYRGDSSLFVDNLSQSFLVIDPAGKVGRPMALPSNRDINTLRRGAGPATDPRGRLVYRAEAFVDAVFYPIVRADFESRRIDTVGQYKARGGRRSTAIIDGRQDRRLVEDPMPVIDAWTMVSDGAIAIVRGADYHIDWIDIDGRVTSTPRMPFDWRRLTDADRQGFLEAAKAAARRADSNARASAALMSRASGRPLEPPAERLFYTLNEISDYFPPMQAGAVRADLENNVWILPTTTAQSQGGEFVYDVVNRKGELRERVRLPAGRSIAGFGRGGAIYMMWRDPQRGWFIERTHVIRPAS